MRKFLLNILYFVIFCLILFITIDVFLSMYLSKSKHLAVGEIQIWKNIYDKDAKVYDIAIYGSSRAKMHFNPKIISKGIGLSSYNYGIDGHNFDLQYFRHNELLKHNKTPKYIVLQVDAINLKMRDNLYNYEQFLPFILWNSNMYKSFKKYKGFNIADYIIPLYRFKGKYDFIAKSILLPNISNDYLGYSAKKETWNNDFDNFIKQQNQAKKSIPDSSSQYLFENFIKECKNNQIKLILVYSPEYIDVEKVISNRNDYIKYYEYIAKKNNIPFLNYMKDSICYDKSNFYNATHLNDIGSNLFSEKFTQDLKKIIYHHAF